MFEFYSASISLNEFVLERKLNDIIDVCNIRVLTFNYVCNLVNNNSKTSMI